MKTVHTYKLKSTMFLPEEADILTVQVQQGIPTLWALVDLQNELEYRMIRVVNVGEEVKENMKYINTFTEGLFDWDVYEKLPRYLEANTQYRDREGN